MKNKKYTPEEILLKHWGFEKFKPLQKEIIENIIDWKDVLSILSTGYGKSICYQVSSQILEWITIVLSPLLSLMEDQVDNIQKLNEIMELDKHGIKSIYLNSMLSADEKKENIIKLLAGDIKLLYISPERFCNDDFINMLINNDVKVSQIVVDEAHCIKLYWQSWFRNSYNQIWFFINKLKDANELVISAFTWTATKETEELIKTVLNLKNPVVYKNKVSNDKLQIFTSYEDSKKEAEDKLIKVCLSLSEIDWKILIFPWTIKQTKEISELLKTGWIESAHYYGGLSWNRKKSIQKKFKNGDIKFLIATSAFWMWIDIPDIRVVIHYWIPLDLESYVQEIWRAWRDWKDCLSIVISSWKDVVTSKFMLNWKKEYQKSLKELNEMINFIREDDKCKKQIIEEYFWNERKENCNKCSSCI